MLGQPVSVAYSEDISILLLGLYALDNTALDNYFRTKLTDINADKKLASAQRFSRFWISSYTYMLSTPIVLPLEFKDSHSFVLDTLTESSTLDIHHTRRCSDWLKSLYISSYNFASLDVVKPLLVMLEYAEASCSQLRLETRMMVERLSCHGLGGIQSVLDPVLNLCLSKQLTVVSPSMTRGCGAILTESIDISDVSYGLNLIRSFLAIPSLSSNIWQKLSAKALLNVQAFFASCTRNMYSLPAPVRGVNVMENVPEDYYYYMPLVAATDMPSYGHAVFGLCLWVMLCHIPHDESRDYRSLSLTCADIMHRLLDSSLSSTSKSTPLVTLVDMYLPSIIDGIRRCVSISDITMQVWYLHLVQDLLASGQVGGLNHDIVAVLCESGYAALRCHSMYTQTKELWLKCLISVLKCDVNLSETSVCSMIENLCDLIAEAAYYYEHALEVPEESEMEESRSKPVSPGVALGEGRGIMPTSSTWLTDMKVYYACLCDLLTVEPPEVEKPRPQKSTLFKVIMPWKMFQNIPEHSVKIVDLWTRVVRNSVVTRMCDIVDALAVSYVADDISHMVHRVATSVMAIDRVAFIKGVVLMHGVVQPWTSSDCMSVLMTAFNPKTSMMMCCQSLTDVLTELIEERSSPMFSPCFRWRRTPSHAVPSSSSSSSSGTPVSTSVCQPSTSRAVSLWIAGYSLNFWSRDDAGVALMRIMRQYLEYCHSQGVDILSVWIMLNNTFKGLHSVQKSLAHTLLECCDLIYAYV